MKLMFLIALLITTPCLADGVNGGTTRGSVSAEFATAAYCTENNCFTSDGEVVEPTAVTTEGGVEYVY